ncbi:MAG TPA: O-antigen polymerase [Candidatus Omnitrophota bacterium]|nr:O-antigen polymerase [Candidatus Omnitrophota bacterium]HPD84087.1 O-antigen polymerase [Candidatus Omnitrophota bacterium]HRZ02944.1 O-antigen polymerase [Candidatus Omnitrophota bacterium]
METKMLKNPIDEKTFIDYILLWLIGVFCFLYTLLGSRFAEMNVTFSFLGFPIFVGEFLMIFCLILLLIKHRGRVSLTEKWHYFLLGYALWVIVRGLWGYLTYGPLSFRNSALFYYPVFAFICFDCFNRTFFGRKINVLILFLLGISMLWNLLNTYCQWAYLCLFVLISFQFKKKWVLYLSFVFVIAYLAQHKLLFEGSRSHVVGNIAAIIFFSYFLIKKFTRSKWQGILIAVCIFLAALFGLFIGADRNALKSMVSFTDLIRDYQYNEGEIRRLGKGFVFKDVPANLYNPDDASPVNDVLPFFRQFQKTQYNYYREFVALKMSEAIDRYAKQITTIVSKVISEQELTGSPEKVAAIKKIFKTILERSQRSVDIYIHRLSVRVVEIGENADGAVVDNSIILIEAKTLREFRAVLEPLVRELNGLTSGELPDLTAYNAVSPNPSASKTKTDDDSANKIIKYIAKGGEFKGDLIEKEIGAILSEKNEIPKEQLIEQIKSNNSGERPVEIARTNIVFRLLIWRDMLVELLEEKAIFGINFGKPQRSRSLEILNWSQLEWGRDGWITPHNSFFHIIYRAGVVGIVMILTIFWAVGHLARIFIKKKSWQGGLLVAVLVYWLAIANFLVFLELPYNAIPFWSFFGVAWAYAESLKHANQEVKYEARA